MNFRIFLRRSFWG